MTTAAETIAVDGGDGGLRYGCNGVGANVDVALVGHGCRRCVADLVELDDIGADAEVVAGSAQQDDANRFVGASSAKRRPTSRQVARVRAFALPAG